MVATKPTMSLDDDANTSNHHTTNRAQLNQHHLPHHHKQLLDYHHQQQPQQNPYVMFQSSSIHGNLTSKDGGCYDPREIDPAALFLHFDGKQDPAAAAHEYSNRQNTGMRPPTLNIFPSQPMHIEPSSTHTNSELLALPASSGSRRAAEPPMDLGNARIDPSSQPLPEPSQKPIKKEGNRKGPASSSEHEGPKTPDPKTLRRLAQNREAARKSRLRKKAYVQQLESCRMKLTQLEQEIQRARNQGIFFGGSVLGDQQGPTGSVPSISPEAAMFEVEYSRWLDEHHRLLNELRLASQEHRVENELKLYVDSCLAHYDQIFNLKAIVAKTDVFHLVSGMWKTPAERFFQWLGGFRPSEVIKVVVSQIEPLTEQQIIGLCNLQQSTQEAEEALSQGLEALNHSLSDTIASDSLSSPPNMTNYMGQMAMAISKLSTLEGFVLQADNLRHQTIHRLHQMLTIRQAARCLLVMAEYFHRLRALSSLWLARPRQD